jgi:hypothetical protein
MQACRRAQFLIVVCGNETYRDEIKLLIETTVAKPI